MTFSDLHVHTTFCDGLDSAEEVIKSAIKLNMTKIGLLVHSYTFFDESYCVKKDKILAFQSEMKALKEKYKDKITVLCGVEQDYYSTESIDGFDYVIGSVHYLKKGEEYFPVDESVEILVDVTNRLYDGDIYALVEDYFETVSNVVEKTKPNIIGHFDLIKKYNKGNALFYETNDRYITAAKKAVDKLIACGKPFEINTGGISRLNLKEPYPSLWLIEYIKEKGGKFILSSDSHKKETLSYAFDKYQNLI